MPRLRGHAGALRRHSVMSCTPVGLQGPYMERQRANAPQITRIKGNSSVMRRIGGKCQLMGPWDCLDAANLGMGLWMARGDAPVAQEPGSVPGSKEAGREGWSDLARRQCVAAKGR